MKVVCQQGIDNSHLVESKNLCKLQYVIYALTLQYVIYALKLQYVIYALTLQYVIYALTLQYVIYALTLQYVIYALTLQYVIYALTVVFLKIHPCKISKHDYYKISVLECLLQQYCML